MRIVTVVAAYALSSVARAEAPVREKVFIPPVKGEGVEAKVLSPEGASTSD